MVASEGRGIEELLSVTTTVFANRGHQGARAEIWEFRLREMLRDQLMRELSDDDLRRHAELVAQARGRCGPRVGGDAEGRRRRRAAVAAGDAAARIEDRAVNVLRGETVFATRFEFPFQFAGCGIDGVKIAIETAEVNRAIRDGGRRRNAAIRLEFPLQISCRGVESIKITVPAADKNRPI